MEEAGQQPKGHLCDKKCFQPRWKWWHALTLVGSLVLLFLGTVTHWPALEGLNHKCSLDEPTKKSQACCTCACVADLISSHLHVCVHCKKSTFASTAWTVIHMIALPFRTCSKREFVNPPWMSCPKRKEMKKWWLALLPCDFCMTRRRHLTTPLHHAKSYRPFELFVNENYKL